MIRGFDMSEYDKKLIEHLLRKDKNDEKEDRSPAQYPYYTGKDGKVRHVNDGWNDDTQKTEIKYDDYGIY